MAIDTGEAPSSTPSLSSSHFRSLSCAGNFTSFRELKTQQFNRFLSTALSRAASMLPWIDSSSRWRRSWICWELRANGRGCRWWSAAALETSSIPFALTDMAEAERALVLERFRQSSVRWNQNSTAQSGDSSKEPEQVDRKSHMIVVTDTCLPIPASGEPAICARVLINYELPTKKETYTRRISTCLAADGIVINMVVGGEVLTLKSLEESSGLLIDEMPINFVALLHICSLEWTVSHIPSTSASLFLPALHSQGGFWIGFVG